MECSINQANKTELDDNSDCFPVPIFRHHLDLFLLLNLGPLAHVPEHIRHKIEDKIMDILLTSADARQYDEAIIVLQPLLSACSKNPDAFKSKFIKFTNEPRLQAISFLDAY